MEAQSQVKEGKGQLVLVGEDRKAQQEDLRRLSAQQRIISTSRYNYVDITTLPTLFPAPIASLITTVATSARVSLRLSAFFIEAMLDGSQYTTRMSLGYTRRLLITAISSARRVYLMSSAAVNGEFLPVVGFNPEDSSQAGKASTRGFLQVLDKYTNLGIYIIHHTFTLAELFTMSGFYLTANAVQSAHFAAQESVALFDGLFGSNESSRALSAIIGMVKRELLEDQRFKEKKKGTIASLTALTKALTAFACLQNATYTFTAKSFKMKLLYDCVVLSEKEESGQYRYTAADNGSPPYVGPPVSTEKRKGIDSPSHLVHETEQLSLDEVNGRLRAHVDRPTEPASEFEVNDWVMDDFNEDVYEAMPERTRTRKRTRRTGKDIYEVTEEYTESTTVTQSFEHVAPVINQSPAQVTHRPMRSEPLSSDVVGRARRSLLPMARSEEHDVDDSEWTAVDRLLDQDMVEASLPDDTVTVSVSQRESPTSPEAEKVQLVLRTTSHKLLSRKRVVRRISTDEVNSESSSGRDSTQTGGRALPWSRGRGGSPSRKATASAALSTAPAEPTLISHSPRRRRGIFPSLPIDPDVGRPVVKPPIVRARSSVKPLTPSHRRTSRASNPALLASNSSPVALSAVIDDEDEDMLDLEDPAGPPPSPRATTSALDTESTWTVPIVSANTSRGNSGSHRRLPSFSRINSQTSERFRSTLTEAPPTFGTDTPEALFPHDLLLKNIHRFMKFSSAAYGQNFLRIFGMGSSEFHFPSTDQHHANTWSFAQHTNLSIDSLLLSSYTESSPTFGQQKTPPLVHYVAVDHDLRAIILTCRGTLGLSDVLIDLTCDYCSVDLEGADPYAEYYAHSGMYRSALNLTSRKSSVHQHLVHALEQYPTYGLVVTGHSLGGGVAGLLSIISSMPSKVFTKQNAEKSKPVEHPPITTPFVTSFASGLPPGRPIHCYTYGVPAITSADLAEYSRGLVTSVIHNSDVVPCLSLGVLRDLKDVALTLFEEGNVAEEIVGRVIGIYRSKLHFKNVSGETMPEQGISDDEATSDWMISLIKTMRADMDNDKLYPPGDVYIMEYHDVFVTVDQRGEGRRKGEKAITHKQAHRATLHKCESVQERFREPLFSKSMLNDHLPSHYERATQLLLDGSPQGRDSAETQAQATSS